MNNIPSTPSASPAKQQKGPLPIVFGIAGHRNPRPEDIPALKERIGEIFQEFRERYPHSPLTLLSSLADGADRLAAHVAVDMGIDLVVPLPLPRTLYLEDFATQESKKEFAEFLDQASEWFELPILPGTTYEEISTYNPKRDEQYASVGAYIARNSQILIVLWDGRYPELVGGTSDVVHYMLDGVPEQYAAEQNPLDPVDNGPVYHIVTWREGEEKPPYPPMEKRILYPEAYENEEEAQKAYDKVFTRIDTFNDDVITRSEVVAAGKQTSKEYILPQRDIEQLPHSLQLLLERYAIADTLAQSYQKHTHKTLMWLFILVFLAVFFFELYAHVFYETTEIIILYLGSLFAAYVWHMIAHRQDYQSKYLDYRALAEGLRIQFFWRLAGLSESAADFYMRRQRSVLDWIRDAVRNWAFTAAHTSRESGTAATATGKLAHNLELVHKHWVEDQLNYFAKATRREEHRLEKMEKWINAFFVLGLLLAAVQIFLKAGHGMILAMGVLPAMAAMIHGYTEKLALSELSKQYERMGMIFAGAHNKLRNHLKNGELEQTQILMREIGKEALVENGDWVLLHRERPVEVPKAG